MRMSLNSLYGVEVKSSFLPCPLQERVLRFLVSRADEVIEWQERFEDTTWHDFFQVKTIDYCGEEVLCAQHTTWESLSPAMPMEIASVPLADVCELGCRHYVMNFTSYILPEEMQKPMKPPRVLVGEEAWPGVCEGLLRRGVCIAMRPVSC